MGAVTPFARPAQGELRWRILVVDDEPSNRRVARRFLEGAGYVVSVAPSAAEALRIVQEQGEFDLYVVDVVMPGMRGTELAEVLRQRQPDALVLFFTAFADILFTGRRVLQDKEAFIQKPVSKHELLEAISQLLFNDLRGPRPKS
jgi:CheY-like chemotaxis protein